MSQTCNDMCDMHIFEALPEGARSWRMSTRCTSGMDGWAPAVRSRNAAITTATCSSYLNTTQEGRCVGARLV
jgi:hypothetical protein